MKKNISTIIKDQDLIEKKRQIIIRSANKLFIKKGFHKTTISQIAKESGLTPGTIYNYIREKEDILFLLHEEIQKKALEQIELGINQGKDIQSKIDNVINNFLDLINKNKDTVRLIFLETANQTKVSLKVLLERESIILSKLDSLLEEGMAENIISVENPRLAASLIHYLIFYQSLTDWDIKNIGGHDLNVNKFVLSSIYRIVGFKGKSLEKNLRK